jgi:Flp pilus assembly pilin Flp
MHAILKFLPSDETAATAVEYGMLLAAVALVALFAVNSVGTNLRALFAGAANAFLSTESGH